MSTIVAGIINTQTGEISDTISNNSGKTALRLKCRDELNGGDGRGIYQAFDFSSSIPNVQWIKGQMHPDADMHELNTLFARYRVIQTKEGITSAQQHLTEAQGALDDCIALYEQSTARRDIIEAALSEVVREAEDALSHAELLYTIANKTLEGLIRK